MFSRLASRLRSGLSPSLRRPLIAWVALQLLFIAIWRIDYVQFPSDEESIRFPAILLAGILWRDYLLILVFSGVMLALAFWRPTARTLWALKYFALLSGVVAFAAVWGLRLADHSYH